MARCGQCGETLTGCQCSMTNSDCFTISGAGTGASPFVVEADLDPDPLNLLECNPSGFGAFLPEVIRNPPMCHVYRTVIQTIPTATQQKVLFNAELFDTDSMHDNAPPNESRITFNTAGVYGLSAHIVWEGSAAGDRKIEIFINGLTIIASQESSPDQVDVFSQSVSHEGWKFAVGEYAEVLTTQNSGIDLDLTIQPEFSMHFVATRRGPG